LADILLDFYHHYHHQVEEGRTKDHEMKAISDKLLEQALGGLSDVA